jgi:hypothetical protein
VKIWLEVATGAAETFLPAGDLAGYANALAAARDHGDGGPLVMALSTPASIPAMEAHEVIGDSDSLYPAGTTFADVQQWTTDTVIPAAPILGRLNVVGAAMRLELPRPAHPITSLHTTAPPVLVVTGLHDFATPANGAHSLADALGNGSYVLTGPAWGHVQFGRNRCIRSRVAGFILDPSHAPDLSDCALDFAAPDQTRAGCMTAAIPTVMSDNRSRETAIGDLIADAMLASAPGATLAIINGGGIGSALPSAFAPADHTLRRPTAGYAAGPPYDLVREDARRVLRFGNRALTMSMTGAQVWQLLEFAVSQPLPSTPFFQVAGIRFTYRASASAGTRVQSVTLADGTAPIVSDGTPYTVVMPDFVYYGGTGATFIADGSGVAHADLADVLADYLASGGACRSTPTAGRITVVP